jgi:hypothetical protein
MEQEHHIATKIGIEVNRPLASRLPRAALALSNKYDVNSELWL